MGTLPISLNFSFWKTIQEKGCVSWLLCQAKKLWVTSSKTCSFWDSSNTNVGQSIKWDATAGTAYGQNHGDHFPASCIGFLLKTVGLWNKKWTLPWQLGSRMHKSQPDVSAHDHNALFTIVHMSLFITSCWKVMTHTWRIKEIYLQTCTERLNFCVSCTA